MIDLRNFVTINIDYVESDTLSRSRETAVLIDRFNEKYIIDSNEIKDLYIESDSDSELSPITNNEVKLAIKIFFLNGGKKLHCLACAGNEKADIIKKIGELPNKEIVIALCNPIDDTVTAETICSELKRDMIYNFTGIKEKIIVDKKDFTKSEFNFNNIHKSDNYVLKHSKSFFDIIGGTGTSVNLFPTDMAVLAYLTQVNIDSIDTVADYNFTKESFLSNMPEYENILNRSLSINDNILVGKVIEESCNCLCELDEGIFRNVGGNTTGDKGKDGKGVGKDLMNHFMKIVLVQTLTDRIMSVLLKKIKYDYNGIEIVSNSMIDELNIYKNNGYLSTNKAWKNEAWIPNGIKVIDKNEMLLNGYKFVIAPFSSLTDAERKAHKFPTIYLVISDAYGVRMVQIDGKVY